MNPKPKPLPKKEAPVIKQVQPWGERHRGTIKKSK